MKLVLTAILVSFLTSCYGWKYEEELQDKESSKNDDYSVDEYNEPPDEDRNEKPDNFDNQKNCSLDPDWMEPEKDWNLWAYLKMIGEIAEYGGEYKPAVYVDGKFNLKNQKTSLMDGAFMNYQNALLYADAQNYEFINVNREKGTGVIDYYHARWTFSHSLISILKNMDWVEAFTGAEIVIRHVYMDVEFESSGEVTCQQIRKDCLLAVSEIEKSDSGYYDIHVGNIKACVYDNIDGSVGEELKMMFKNKITDDSTVIINYLNTQGDGSVFEYGDEGFVHQCKCFDTEGNEVNCWKYDGPGGPEECPGYVPEEECETGNDSDQDEISDEDIYDPCYPNPCLEITGSDGNCTGDGYDFFCGCNENYKWDSENNLCDPERKLVDCNNTIPENSSYSGTGKFYQTWDGDSWEPAVSQCEWECDEGYTKSGEECLKNDEDIMPDVDV